MIQLEPEPFFSQLELNNRSSEIHILQRPNKNTFQLFVKLNTLH